MTEPDDDTCRPVEIDGELIRVRGSGDMSDESRAALADVIRAAKRKFAAEHPPRLTVDTITSDQLDALYDRLEAAEETESQRQLATAREALASATVRAAKAERAVNLLADSHRRAEQAEASIRDAAPFLSRALDCLDTTCRYHGDQLDPDHFGRMTRSEACCDTGVEPHRAREARQALDRLRAALDEPKEPTKPHGHLPGERTAKDCRACASELFDEYWRNQPKEPTT